MDLGTFARGLVLGFSIATVVGPISLLCIRRTLAGGLLAGLLSGLGVATADGLYASVAAFGLTVVSNALVEQRFWLRLVGGVFLCYLGIRTLRTLPAETPATVAGFGLVGLYASTLGLTLTNPMTILSFAAVFAGLGLGAAGSGLGTAISLVVGTFLGSAFWWLVLTTFVATLRARLTTRLLRGANLVSGAVITGFGALALLSAVQR